MMNSKERVRLAMNHKLADRVPLMCQLATGHYFVNMRDQYKPHEIWFNSEAWLDSAITLAQRYSFDGILLNIPGRHPDTLNSIQSIKETDQGEQLTFNDGTQLLVPWDDNALLEIDRPGRLPHATFENFDPDYDFKQIPRYTWGVYHTPALPDTDSSLLIDIPDYFFRTIDKAIERVGDKLSIHGEVFSPFTHFMELFGYQNALMGLITDEGRAHAVLERLTESVIAWSLAQSVRGVDAILISSAFAGGGFISPAMYKQFVVPYERKVADAVHAHHTGTPVYTHTCGKLGDRLELMIETNIDGIDTLDPPPLGNTGLADAKSRIGDRLFIKGNLNSVAILSDDESQFVKRVTETLQTGKPGGGYILSTACSVAPHVEPWKLERMIGIVDEHGWYNK